MLEGLKGRMGLGERRRGEGGFEYTKIEDGETAVSAKHLTVKYIKDGKEFIAVNDVNLEVPKGQFLAIVGQSGSGKTTLIETMAGLNSGKFASEVGRKKIQTSGRVSLQGKMRFVFQNFEAWPHMTVDQHMNLMKKGKDISLAAQMNAKTNPLGTAMEQSELLSSLGIEEQAGKYSNEMSGGQRRRISLATQLAGDPDVLFMDEPFSSLDEKTKDETHDMLLKIREKFPHKTVVIVTHDLREALLLAERVVAMRQGNIVSDYKVPFAYPRNHELKFDPGLIAAEKELYKNL